VRLLAIVLDLLAVVVFAALGRRSHDSGDGVVAVLDIAWPFAVGAVVGHLLLLTVPALRQWPPVTRVAGAVVWLTTLVLGMLLRQATGDGTAWSFVLVATGVLGAALLGWRIVASLVTPRRV
jgi:hypothetical protein